MLLRLLIKTAAVRPPINSRKVTIIILTGGVTSSPTIDLHRNTKPHHVLTQGTWTDSAALFKNTNNTCVCVCVGQLFGPLWCFHILKIITQSVPQSRLLAPVSPMSSVWSVATLAEYCYSGFRVRTHITLGFCSYVTLRSLIEGWLVPLFFFAAADLSAFKCS